MKRKYWVIFGAIQAVGIMATIDAMFLQFPSLLLVAPVFLLPGSLCSIALYWRQIVAGDWSPWILCSIAVTTNAVLFSVVSVVVARYRKSK